MTTKKIQTSESSTTVPISITEKEKRFMVKSEKKCSESAVSGIKI
jgi:hypothetical protein